MLCVEVSEPLDVVGGGVLPVVVAVVSLGLVVVTDEADVVTVVLGVLPSDVVVIGVGIVVAVVVGSVCLLIEVPVFVDGVKLVVPVVSETDTEPEVVVTGVSDVDVTLVVVGGCESPVVVVDSEVSEDVSGVVVVSETLGVVVVLVSGVVVVSDLSVVVALEDSVVSLVNVVVSSVVDVLVLVRGG